MQSKFFPFVFTPSDNGFGVLFESHFFVNNNSKNFGAVLDFAFLIVKVEDSSAWGFTVNKYNIGLGPINL